MAILRIFFFCRHTTDPSGTLIMKPIEMTSTYLSTESDILKIYIYWVLFCIVLAKLCNCCLLRFYKTTPSNRQPKHFSDATSSVIQSELDLKMDSW
jgi:hypothetical protein